MRYICHFLTPAPEHTNNPLTQAHKTILLYLFGVPTLGPTQGAMPFTQMYVSRLPSAMPKYQELVTKRSLSHLELVLFFSFRNRVSVLLLSSCYSLPRTVRPSVLLLPIEVRVFDPAWAKRVQGH